MSRESGGCVVRLENFSLTSAILFTSDFSQKGMVVTLQNQQRDLGRMAAQWLHDQAQEEIEKTERVVTELEAIAPALSDARALLARARSALARCHRHRINAEHTEAYEQAEVALRALRLLRRAYWDRAVRDIDSPVCTPYGVSFYTLPQHWRMLGQMQALYPPAPSVLPGGDFEMSTDQALPGWIAPTPQNLDPVQCRVRRVTDRRVSGRQSVLLQVWPNHPKEEPDCLERTAATLHSPEVQLPPGTYVRISAKVFIPAALRGSPDGLMFYDSSVGEGLAMRMTDATKNWRRVSLYRKVGPSGKIRVTLSLNAIGAAYVDDVTIEPFGVAANEVIQTGHVAPMRAEKSIGKK
jgi:hypothetical protein